ncbi:hypothetical protein [Niallia endozanthoxylica]|uniref:hypothetical protein n=1 Tax=Niallia endozanthoxylica TaxID=2036016 RepID=UPI00168A6513|nr:hypothetical protein [Niallia endozanthoxylica]
MTNRNPVEFSGKVLDQRKTLTGPDDASKASYPVRPQHVPIKETHMKHLTSH